MNRLLPWRQIVACTCLLVLTSITCAAQTPPTGKPGSPGTSQPADRLLAMETLVNGAKGGTWLYLERAGVVYAPREAFDEWRVELQPGTPTIEFKGQAYAPLTAIPGFKSKVDFANQSVALFFSPEAFATLRMTQELSKRPVVSPVLPSLFVNYDLNYSGSRFRDAATTSDLGALGEVGFSSQWGILTTSIAGSNLMNQNAPGSERSWRRLETTFTRDFPDQNRTVRLGDSTTRAGAWGRNAYFGGIQFGTNFALTPGFVRQPLPVLSGLSAAPSTVELYINDVLRQTSSVPTGPFTLDNFPVMSGAGEARLVVRDLLGRETVINQSFLTSTQLLAKGLDDWSLEAGTLRRDLGTTSNRYGQGFASGTWSRGLTSEITLEGRAEATRDLQLGGLTTVIALRNRLLGRVGLVGSREKTLGSGTYWLLGLEQQGLRSGASFEVRGASRNFRQLGLEKEALPHKLQAAGNFSLSAAGGDSYGLGFASIHEYGGQKIETVSANYSTRIGAQGSLNLSASRAISGGAGSAVGVTLSLPLGGGRLLNGSYTHRAGQSEAYVAAAQNPNSNDDLGWRLLAGGQQDRARGEGGVYYLGRYGTVTGDVSVTRDQKVVRLGTTGGLVLTDGRLFATRRVDESFAVVEVAGYGGVGIGLGGNVLTRTDETGIAVVPRLIPYQNNAIRLDPRELPINAELDSIELNVVPAWRSAVKAKFPVRSGRGALLKIVLDDGQPVPPGAVVKLDGDPEEFYVARRGEAFVTGLKERNRLTLRWKDQECRLEAALPADLKDEIARIGPLACKGVAR